MVINKFGLRCKALLNEEYHTFRAEVSIPEYIVWWILRLILLSVIIAWSVSNARGETSYHSLQIIQIWANLAATFIVPIFRIVFPKRLFLGRLPYRAQKWGTFLCFFNCFFGHCLGLNLSTYLFAAAEHFISGFVLVFMCYHIILSMRHDKRELSPLISSVCGFGMSSFCHIAWEIFEFVVDYLVEGSGYQDYSYAYTDDYLLYRLVGHPANPGQTPLFDTMSDLTVALLASVIGGALLWLTVYKKQKSKASESVLKQPVQAAE